MSTLINAIGLFGTALGLVGFIQDNIPPPPEADGTTVRVKVGLSQGDDEAQLDGGIEGLYAWDVNNNYIGQADGTGVVLEGDFFETMIDQTSGGTRAEFVGVGATNNAICISWITVKQQDDTQGGAWTGDIGASCGQVWYQQAEFAGYLGGEEAPQTADNQYFPRCTWLDNDQTADVLTASLKFRTLAYGSQAVDTVDKQKQCSSTVYGQDSGPLPNEPARRSTDSAYVPLHKRERLQWIQDMLVVSNITQHSSESLCSSETSYGPDFVDAHGYFCDMDTKTLAPLCSLEDIDGCVSMDAEEKRINKRTTVARRSVELAHKVYKKVENWGT